MQTLLSADLLVPLPSLMEEWMVGVCVCVCVYVCMKEQGGMQRLFSQGSTN